jgi:HK97 gp10 family phage protein
LSKQTEALKGRFAAIPKAVKEAVFPALMQSGQELADRMKALAPEKTGALKDSIVVTPPGGTTPAYGTGGQRTARETQVIVTAGNTAVRYASHIEYGTRHAHAEPFFWPAYRLSKKREISRIARAINKAVKTEWAR